MEQTITAASNRIKILSLFVVLSIIIFVVFYVAIASGVIYITFGFGYSMLDSFATVHTASNLLLGLGVMSFGLVILIFLIKFIFKKSTFNTDLFIEVNEKDEPRLFEAVKTISDAANTRMPKKIFISPNVNAEVVFNSNFLSMFFPSGKNLIIGLGLVNSTTASEFKAVLAHEFGHFSQGSMVVGSYVYYANRAIYNMLYDNNDFDSMVKKWVKIHGLIGLFVIAAVKVIRGIQWILKQLYSIVNKSYSKLSIEMEFHADAISADIAGSKNLINSLLRLDLAEYALSSVLNYYIQHEKESTKTLNIYPQQSYIIDLLARKNKLVIENNLPLVNLNFTSRFNKSKLNIEDQWASHPSLNDRVAALEKLNTANFEENGKPAFELFTNAAALQEKCTEKVFSLYGLTDVKCIKEKADFIREFTREYESYQLNEIFNNYYDEKELSVLNLDQITQESNHNKDFDDLFSNTMTNLVYTSIALKQDIDTLNNIVNGDYKIKSFDYDGIKYSKKYCNGLIRRLKKELKDVNEKIKSNDIEIFKYFFCLAQKESNEDQLKEKYLAFFKYYPDFKVKMDFYENFIKSMHFIYKMTPYNEIAEGVKAIMSKENKFKKYISQLLRDEICCRFIKDELKKNLYAYLGNDWIYFEGQKYNQAALNALNAALYSFQYILKETLFILKKDILDFKVELIKIKQ